MYSDLFSQKSVQDLLTVLPSLPFAVWETFYVTVVVITHQMSVVKEICSHVAILDEGQVAEAGLVGTVFAAPKSAAGRRLVFPGGADAQVYDPAEEKLVRLVFKDSKTTSIPLIARLAAEEGILCNVISASTQKLSETVYGSMMLGIPSSQFDKAVAFIHNVANVQVEEVERVCTAICFPRSPCRTC